jgi:cyclophilin family peptidyl-prolyl cis-trans isomerase
MIQGGDFTLRNGKGGESIYGGVFDDEDLRRTIDEPGFVIQSFFMSFRPFSADYPSLNSFRLLVMANKGKK